MARFNNKSVGTKTVNLASGEAFSQSPKLEFISILLTSFVQDKFYQTAGEGIKRLQNLIQEIPDKKFCAKGAIYARTKFGMRSISHIVAGEIAKHVKGESWTKDFFDKVVYRPDDMTEIVSYYCGTYGKPIPNSLKKGLAKAIGRFDSYSLAKYRGETNALKLIDLVNLIHPKPTEKNKDALAQLAQGKLKSEDTWEAKLTQAGQKGTTDEEKLNLKASAWRELIKERKLRYFALLRNLRNIHEQAPDVLDEALAMLVDSEQIKKSLVLPFRFTTAMEQIEQIAGSSKILKALSKAVDIALQNVPQFDGKTCIVLDCSGSMKGKPAQIGSLFMAIMAKRSEADCLLFSDNAKYLSFNPDDSTLTLAKSVRFASGGTNFKAIFPAMNKAYDRVLILSDMQGWIMGGQPSKEFNDYKTKFNCNPKVYSWDLNGYGTLQFPERNIYCLAGFSEKVFDLMKFLEQDRDAMINEIEKVEIVEESSK